MRVLTASEIDNEGKDIHVETRWVARSIVTNRYGIGIQYPEIEENPGGMLVFVHVVLLFRLPHAVFDGIPVHSLERWLCRSPS